MRKAASAGHTVRTDEAAFLTQHYTCALERLTKGFYISTLWLSDRDAAEAETRNRSGAWQYNRNMRAMRGMLRSYVQKAVADAGSWRWPGRGRWFGLGQA